ncbi:MAG: PAS domain S-box protein, partial [Bacteroidales bacterium]|nr:PAS domain S-box protein [Bacteroidales bacterium]
MDDNYNLDEAITQKSILKHKILELEKKIKEYEAGEEIKNRLIEVFRSTPQLMAISNLIDGTYIDVNENFLKTLGYKRDEIINKNSGEIQLFADMVQSDKFIRKLSKLKKVEKFPVTLRTKSGETRDFLFSAETIIFGEERYLLTTYSEIYDDDEASAKLNETLENLRHLFASLSNFVMIISCGADGHNIIESINPLSNEFKGVQESDIILKNQSETDIGYKNIFLELISKINLTGNPHKQTLVADGIEDEGYYFGIKLNSGEIAILWEPGKSYKLKEKELLMQGDIFERFADLLPDMVFEINSRGELTYANPKGLKKFGYTQKDVAKGITIRTIFGEEQLKKIFLNLRKIKKPADTMHNEYEAYRKDGSIIFVQTHTYGLFDNGNNPVGYRGILTDVTNTKEIKAEIELEKTRLAVLIESAPESIIQTSTDGTVLFVNHEFLREFEFIEEEVIGKNIDELIVPQEIRSEGEDLTRKASSKETISIETIRQKKNGKKIYVSLLIKPIVINEEVTALFAIYRNITDKKQISETRNVIYNISNAALIQTEFTDIYSIIKKEISKIWETKNFYIVLYDKENETLSLPFYSDEKDKFEKVPIKGTLTGWLIKNRKPILLTESDIEVLEHSGEVGLVGTPCKVWLGVPLIIDNDIIGAMVLQDY